MEELGEAFPEVASLANLDTSVLLKDINPANAGPGGAGKSLFIRDAWSSDGFLLWLMRLL